MDLNSLRQYGKIVQELLRGIKMEEIFFIDYGNSLSRKNWNKIEKLCKNSADKHLRRIPWQKENIKQSLENFSKQSYCKKFWVVEGNIKLLPTFKFNCQMPEWDEIYVYTWRVITGKKFKMSPGGVYYLTKNYKSYKYLKQLAGVRHDEFDIFFISYNEEYADQNYKMLTSRFPNAKRINGVKGIHNAHIEAARRASSEMFWVVDADAIIDEKFNFSYKPDTWNLDQVHVWRSRNPVNDLIYGYGGVKLLPTNLTLNMDTNSVDMTTSISLKFKPMNQVSNITMFNTDEWSTWRSAFRECAKLSSKAINGEVNIDSAKRLDIWCTRGFDAPFGKWAIAGAHAGRQYGIDNAGDKEALSKINDFIWLNEKYLTYVRERGF